MEDLKKIAEDIAASYDARARIVGEIADDTQRLLLVFREQRENMAKTLKETLANSENLRRKDFDKMMQDILATQEERERNVKQILDDFSKEEGDVARHLRKLLKRGDEVRVGDFKKTITKIRKKQEKRQKEVASKASSELVRMQREVSGMLDNFKKEREKMASAWSEALKNK
jgi:hypothetical protein